MGERAGELAYGDEPGLDNPADSEFAAGRGYPDELAEDGMVAEVFYGDSAGRTQGDTSTTPAATSSDTTSDEDPDTAQLRGNIEQTRQQMSNTIDAIQDRLSPSNLVHEAQHAVRDATIGRVEEVFNDMTDTVQGAGNSLLDTIRENPIPAALTAVGLGWLIYKAINNNQSNNYGYYGNRRYAQEYGPYYQGDYGAYGYRNYNSGNQNMVGQATGAVQDAAGNVTDKVQDVAGNVAGTVQDAAGNVADTAQQLASQAQDQVQQIGYQAQYGMVRARNWLEQTWESNPLALGAAALAAGAIIGGLIPETPIEDRLMGEQRDTMLQKAEGLAQDTVQKVQSAAQEALGNVQQNVKQNQQSQSKPQTGNGSSGSSTAAQTKGQSTSSPSSTRSTSSSASSQTPPPTTDTSTQTQTSAR